MENTQEQPPLCQRCQMRPATHFMDWPEDLLTTLPEGASREDYLPAYERLCDVCFDLVFQPVAVESVEGIHNVLKKWDSAKRLVDG